MNAATGRVIGRCFGRHRSREFLKFLEEIGDRATREPGVEIRIIMGNCGARKAAAARRRFERHLHSTPTGGSWLDQVERSFAEIAEERI